MFFLKSNEIKIKFNKTNKSNADITGFILITKISISITKQIDDKRMNEILKRRMNHFWLSNALYCVCTCVVVSFALVIRLSLSVYLHRIV